MTEFKKHLANIADRNSRSGFYQDFSKSVQPTPIIQPIFKATNIGAGDDIAVLMQPSVPNGTQAGQTETPSAPAETMGNANSYSPYTY
jgi:hypothetical protein